MKKHLKLKCLKKIEKEKIILLIKEGDILVFLFIFLIVILMILTIRIKIKFVNFKFSSLGSKHLNNDFILEITIYVFLKIPILKNKITNAKVRKLINNEKIKRVIKKQEMKIIENRKNIDKDIISVIKNIKIPIEEMNLKIFLGTENATITAFVVPIISTIIAIFLSRKVEKCNKNQIFLITPIYSNQNLINIEFSGIFQIKMFHIINTILIFKKKRKGDKNERTSNRRSYDYSYE